MGTLRVLGIFFVMGLLLGALRVFGAEFYFFDVDNTLFESREEYGGTFQTPIELYRIHYRNNVLQSPISTQPEVISINQADLERVKKFLAQNETTPGPIGKKVTLTDGRTIEPGNYYLLPAFSFRHFRSAQYNGWSGNNFSRSIHDAIQKKPSGLWKGPAWELFKTRLSLPETAKRTGLLTIRDQVDEMITTFRAMKASTKNTKGLSADARLGNEPASNLVFNLGGEDWEQYTINYNGRDKHLGKSDFLHDFIAMLGKVELKDSDKILDPDGGSLEKYHYLVFIDDNQATLENVARVFQKMAQGKYFRIKFALVNAGTKTEIRESGRPVFSVVTSRGTFRNPRPEEVVGSEFTKGQAKNCLDALNRVSLKGGR